VSTFWARPFFASNRLNSPANSGKTRADRKSGVVLGGILGGLVDSVRVSPSVGLKR